MTSKKESTRFDIINNPTKEEMRVFKKRLQDYNMEQTNGEWNKPEIEINLVLKDNDGNVLGGINASILYWVMWLEIFWVDEKYRGLGYGRKLLLEAEKIGKNHGCVASGTWTFSFQAPEFYQRVGYEVIGVFDGYVNGITEYVLLKNLNSDDPKYKASVADFSKQFTISDVTNDDDMKIVSEGLHEFVAGHVGELRKQYPEIGIRFIVKNRDEEIIGGMNAGTTLGTMFIEEIWVDEEYRGQGYGKALLLNAEDIAKQYGCISGQIWILSFQNPSFFWKMGYEAFGISEGYYPNGIKEYDCIKRF
jgi:ribosomal protein S18 acetylase RimI-like enzyme